MLRQERRLVLVGEPPEPGPAWADEAEDTEALAALAGLSAERRAVVVLRLLLDYAPSEIAEILEIPEGP